MCSYRKNAADAAGSCRSNWGLLTAAAAAGLGLGFPNVLRVLPMSTMYDWWSSSVSSADRPTTGRYSAGRTAKRDPPSVLPRLYAAPRPPYRR